MTTRWLLLVVAVAILSLGQPALVAASPCTPPPTGMVGWWPGNGDADDIAGSDNNGALQGGATFAAGEVGQAFSFNGTSADVKVPASPSLNVGAGLGLTVDLWVNPTSVATRQPLVEWNNPSASPQPIGVHFWITATTTGDSPGALFANLIDTSGGNHIFSTSAGGFVTAGVFTHVALTYDKASGVATLYANGVSVATSTLGSFTPQTSYDLYFATRPANGINTPTPFWFGGKLDEVEVFQRALSASEIQAIFNAGSAGKCENHLSAGLVSYWKANGNAKDAQGTNDGALEGTTSFDAGHPGLAFRFNGNAADVVSVPDAPDLNFAPTAPMSVALWAYGPANTTFVMIGKRHGCSNLGSDFVHYHMGWFNGTQFGGFYFGGQNDVNQLPANQANANIPFPGNTWTHVAGTFDGSTLRIYVNGTLVATQPGSVMGPIVSDPLLINGDGTCSEPFTGRIDEVQIYNQALSVSDVATIMALTTPVLSGCFQMPGGDLSNQTVSLKEKKLKTSSVTDADGCFENSALTSGHSFKLTMTGPTVTAPPLSGCLQLLGEPLAGVAVKVKESSKSSATTNVDGCFSDSSVTPGHTFTLKLKGPVVP